MPKPKNGIGLSRNKIFFYLLSLAAFILIYTRFNEFSSVKNIIQNSDPRWLTGIIISQLVQFFFWSLNYRDVLRMKEAEVPLRELYPMTFMIHFINLVLPSGSIAGQVFFISYFVKKGGTIAEGIGRAILEILTLYLAFGFMFAITIVFILKEHLFTEDPVVWFLIYAFLFFAALVSGIIYAAQERRRARWLIKQVHKIHRFLENTKYLSRLPGIKSFVEHHEQIVPAIEEIQKTTHVDNLRGYSKLFWLATLWQALGLCVNVLTLHFTILALGFHLPLAASFITFMLTKFLSLISVIPGALGFFEGAMTLILTTFGLPVGTSFSIMLVFRIFTFWMPMAIGWLLYGRHSQNQENI